MYNTLTPRDCRPNQIYKERRIHHRHTNKASKDMALDYASLMGFELKQYEGETFSDRSITNCKSVEAQCHEIGGQMVRRELGQRVRSALGTCNTQQSPIQHKKIGQKILINNRELRKRMFLCSDRGKYESLTVGQFINCNRPTSASNHRRHRSLIVQNQKNTKLTLTSPCVTSKLRKYSGNNIKLDTKEPSLLIQKLLSKGWKKEKNIEKSKIDEIVKKKKAKSIALDLTEKDNYKTVDEEINQRFFSFTEDFDEDYLEPKGCDNTTKVYTPNACIKYKWS